MRVWALRVLAAVLGVAAGLGSPLGTAAEPGDIARQVLREGGYPNRVYVRPDGSDRPRLIVGEGAARTEGDQYGPDQSTDRETGDGPSDRIFPDDRVKTPTVGLNLGNILLILLIAGIVAYFLWWVLSYRGARDWGDRQSPSSHKGPLETKAHKTERALEVEQSQDPDELAKRGHIEEALHTLLLRALERAGWQPYREGRSRTAREVVQGLPVSDPRRIALQEIVRTVEVVRFGGAPGSKADYETVKSWLSEIRPKQEETT